MALLTFTWNPDLGAQRSIKPTVHQTKFGDGYELRVKTAINSKPKKWTIRFSRNITETLELLGFLDARDGVEAFNWVDALGVTGTYVCREWSSSQKVFGVYETNATFEQVFEF